MSWPAILSVASAVVGVLAVAACVVAMTRSAADAGEANARAVAAERKVAQMVEVRRSKPSPDTRTGWKTLPVVDRQSGPYVPTFQWAEPARVYPNAGEPFYAWITEGGAPRYVVKVWDIGPSVDAERVAEEIAGHGVLDRGGQGRPA